MSSLFVFVRRSLESKVYIKNEIAWIDSSIVLSWLRSPPHNWTTYVANRVVEIQNILSPDKWRHVRSSDNPADCAPRGLSPSEISKHVLCWSGLSWLILPEDRWPVSSIDLEHRIASHSRATAISKDCFSHSRVSRRTLLFHKVFAIS